MQWNIRVRKLSITSVFGFQFVNHQKTWVLRWNIRVRKLPTTVGSFCNWILVSKTQKNMRFTLEHLNTKTPIIVDSFSVLGLQIAKHQNHAFNDWKSEYGNCPQLQAVSVFGFQFGKHQRTCVLKWKTRRRKLPIIVDSFRIWILDGKTPKKMHFTAEHLNTETTNNYCWQFPYLDYNWLNTIKKHAFNYGTSEYGNYLQL